MEVRYPDGTKTSTGYNAAGRRVAQTNQDNIVTRFGYDGHGSTRALTTTNGGVANTFAYDAYGTLIASNAAPQTVYLYTGEQFDPHLGFYYLRARYLNTGTGRFWTRDSWEGNQSDPLSLHKYMYCHADPVNRIDPSGQFTLSESSVSTFIQGSLRALDVAFRVYRGYAKVSDILDIIDTGRIAVRFIRALNAVTPEAAVSALYGEIRRSFGEEGLEALSEGLGGALGALNEYWEGARKAITEKTPEMSSRAAAGVAPHIPKLIQAHQSRNLKYVISLPSGPGDYDRSSKRTITLSRKLVVEVAPTGGSLFGLLLQYGSGARQRIPVIRVDYWDVRASTANKISLHYHVPPNMRDHYLIWTAPGVRVN